MLNVKCLTTFYFFQCFSRGWEDSKHQSDHDYEIIVSIYPEKKVLYSLLVIGSTHTGCLSEKSSVADYQDFKDGNTLHCAIFRNQ